MSFGPKAERLRRRMLSRVPTTLWMWKTLPLLLSLVVAPAFADEPAPVPRPDSGYRVGPGDVLQVRVYRETGLTGGFPVGEAGNLDFPLIGLWTVSRPGPWMALYRIAPASDG